MPMTVAWSAVSQDSTVQDLYKKVAEYAEEDERNFMLTLNGMTCYLITTCVLTEQYILLAILFEFWSRISLALCRAQLQYTPQPATPPGRSSAAMADGLSVWLVRRSGIPCRTACGIRLLARTVSDNL